jgi:hypothetical protein
MSGRHIALPYCLLKVSISVHLLTLLTLTMITNSDELWCRRGYKYGKSVAFSHVVVIDIIIPLCFCMLMVGPLIALYPCHYFIPTYYTILLFGLHVISVPCFRYNHYLSILDGGLGLWTTDEHQTTRVRHVLQYAVLRTCILRQLAVKTREEVRYKYTVAAERCYSDSISVLLQRPDETSRAWIMPYDFDPHSPASGPRFFIPRHLKSTSVEVGPKILHGVVWLGCCGT